MLMESARDMAASELIKMAEEGLDFAVVVSDNTGNGKMGELMKLFPEKCFDVGIAEANQTGIAAGLALTQRVVFAQYFGPFLSLRATDQVHTDVAYNDLPVRLISTHGGLSSGGGPSHNSVLDCAIMRAIPNMTVIVPADAGQCIKVIRASMSYHGPMFIRLARAEVPTVYEKRDYGYEIGKAITIKQGRDLTLIGSGLGVALSVEAAKTLESEGVSVGIIDMHTLKPLDTEAIVHSARETGRIITVEDHSVIGGLGGAVAETIAESSVPCTLRRMGIPDMFCTYGVPNDLYAHHGLNADGVVSQARNILSGVTDASRTGS